MEIINWISKYGIYMVMLVILLEYACLPISSEIVLPFAGILAQREEHPLVLVILFSVVFGLMGSLLCYFVGFIFRKAFRKKPKIEIKKSLSSLVCRLIPITRTYISFYQGIKGENIFKFILLSMIGILIWNASLISLGYYIGNNSELINFIINKYKYFVIFIVAFFMLKIIVKYYKKE